MRSFAKILLTIGGLLLAVSLRADDALPKEAAEDFQWFGTLGFPDLRGCPMARVNPGGQRRYGDQVMTEQFFDAFLIRHDPDGKFAVLTPELVTREHTATPGDADLFPVGYEERELGAAADAYLDTLDKQSKDPGDAMSRHFGQQLSERGQIFVWAWACWRNGLDDRAARLYAKAAAVKIYHRDREEPASFRERLEQDLGYVAIWRATLDFGQPEIPRSELLRRFEKVARDYPRSLYIDGAKDTVERLRKMIAEDEAHAAKGGPALETLPPERRVRELIYRLRDQTGHQYMQPGSCDIFDVMEYEARGKKNPTPAGQLVELGTQAVPGLIAALDDQRYSRAVGYWRDFTFSHHVLTISDCAEQILERIAGKGLFSPKTTSSYPSTDGGMAGIKAQAEAWWKEMQTKGERQTLIDAVSVGDEDGARQAELLIKRYPDAALEPIIAGTRRAKGWNRGWYVQAMGVVPGEGALDALREEMRGGPEIGPRVHSAQALARRGHGDEAVAAMIDAWERGRDWREGKGEYPYFWLTRFLVGSRRVDAVQALGRDLRGRDITPRKDVTLAFDPGSAADAANGWEKQAKNSGSGPGGQKEVDEAIEALLAGELEDTQVEPDGGTAHLRLPPDARVCDAAAAVLAARFPERYSFDAKAPPKARERQRIACLNVWRKGRGEAELPMPAERKIEPASEEEIGPALRTLAAGSGGAEETRAAEAAVRKLGLRALAPLRAFLAAGSVKDEMAGAQLRALERSLACTVVETKLEGVVIADEAERRQVEARVEAWRGQPLTAEAFVDCLIWMGAKVPGKVEGFRLRAERDEDLSGARVTLTILKSTAGTRDPRYAQTKESVSLGGDTTLNSSGGFVREYLEKSEGYKSFAEKAALVCRTESDRAFTMDVSVWMGRP